VGASVEKVASCCCAAADQRIASSRAAKVALSDPRDPKRVTHSQSDLLAQRI
jgi:hypothetical protein